MMHTVSFTSSSSDPQLDSSLLGLLASLFLCSITIPSLRGPFSLSVTGTVKRSQARSGYLRYAQRKGRSGPVRFAALG